jgi:hypothetical protein
MALLSQWDSQTPIFVRIAANGPIIEGALTYRAMFDFCCLIADGSGPSEEEDNIGVQSYTCVIAHDPTWGRALDWNFRNQVTAL